MIAFLKILIIVGVVGAILSEVLPFFIKVAGQQQELGVLAISVSYFFNVFARFFVFLINPVAAFLIETNKADISELVPIFFSSFLLLLMLYFVIYIFRNQILKLLQCYIGASYKTNSYLKPFFGKHDISIVELDKSSNAEVDLKMVMLNFSISFFLISVTPIILTLAGLFEQYRLTIFTLSPAITFIGSFLNQSMFQRMLAHDLQSKKSVYRHMRSILLGRSLSSFLHFIILIIVYFSFMS